MERCARCPICPGENPVEVFQSGAVQIFHGDEGTPFNTAYLMNGADIWMVQRGRRTRLSPEAFQSFRASCQMIRKEFKGDKPAKPGVLGFVDDAHPTTTELFDDAVVRESLAEERVGVCHVLHMLGWGQETSQRREANERLDIACEFCSKFIRIGLSVRAIETLCLAAASTTIFP
jgi:hypothetical protein